MRRLALAILFGFAAMSSSGSEETAPGNNAETISIETQGPTLTLTLSDYRSSLAGISEALASSDFEEARCRTGLLSGRRYAAGGQILEIDSSITDGVLGVRSRTDASRICSRIRETLRNLPNEATNTGPPQKTQPALLEELRRSEAVLEIKKGGSIEGLPNVADSIPEEILQEIESAFDWIAEKLHSVRKWLRKLWPRRSGAGGQETAGISTMVTVLVSLVVALLLVLAYRVWRRKRNAAALPPAESGRIAESRRDADPLSRGAGEWEIYASELAARGRIREAIRAWYHAVLVALYGAGLLHYRKGRTNWEYVSSLRSELPWRPDFIEITRRFEQEWYGRRESSAEALRDCTFEAQKILRGVREEGEP